MKPSAEHKYFYCKKTKSIKTTCSQTWSIKSKTYQGSCHIQKYKFAMMKREIQNTDTKKLNQEAKVFFKTN